MRDVRFKDHPGVGGPGNWTHGLLTEFLFRLPYFFYFGKVRQPIPPLHILNGIFRSGKFDAGMSGGCEWKPFEIDEKECSELVQELIARPECSFVEDKDLWNSNNFRQWNGKRMSKYNPRKDSIS